MGRIHGGSGSFTNFVNSGETDKSRTEHALLKDEKALAKTDTALSWGAFSSQGEGGDVFQDLAPGAGAYSHLRVARDSFSGVSCGNSFHSGVDQQASTTSGFAAADAADAAAAKAAAEAEGEEEG